MITLNNVSLPSPASLSVRTSLQGGTTAYNALGQLVQDGMRQKRTIEVSWVRLPESQLAVISGAVAEGFISCTYPDPLLGNRTMVCRVTGHSAQLWRYQAEGSAWADVRITLEEQ